MQHMRPFAFKHAPCSSSTGQAPVLAAHIHASRGIAHHRFAHGVRTLTLGSLAGLQVCIPHSRCAHSCHAF
eukprot:6883053-Prorocentrum_lima.AAC.1